MRHRADSGGGRSRRQWGVVPFEPYGLDAGRLPADAQAITVAQMFWWGWPKSEIARELRLTNQTVGRHLAAAGIGNSDGDVAERSRRRGDQIRSARERWSGVNSLERRRQAVAEGLKEGLSIPQIADRLRVTPPTARSDANFVLSHRDQYGVPANLEVSSSSSSSHGAETRAQRVARWRRQEGWPVEDIAALEGISQPRVSTLLAEEVEDTWVKNEGIERDSKEGTGASRFFARTSHSPRDVWDLVRSMPDSEAIARRLRVAPSRVGAVLRRPGFEQARYVWERAGGGESEAAIASTLGIEVGRVDRILADRQLRETFGADEGLFDARAS